MEFLFFLQYLHLIFYFFYAFCFDYLFYFPILIIDLKLIQLKIQQNHWEHLQIYLIFIIYILQVNKF